VHGGGSLTVAGVDGRAPRTPGRQIETEIESVLAERTGRACVFMPSGRLGLHLAFRLLLSPGDRVLMSPLEDDTVFFGALAAGLRPVMAPISTADGNMEPEAVPPATWERLNAVLTANVYGLPDRVMDIRVRCEERKIPLIEDVAHALQTDVEGRPVGTFGTASVFSLSKHLPGRGGVLALADASSRAAAVRLLDELTADKPKRRRGADVAKTGVRGALGAIRLMPAVDRARQRRRTGNVDGWRIPLQASRLAKALSDGGGLDAFDGWMRTAYADYRMAQRTSSLKRTLAGLRDLARDRQSRIEGVARLQQLDAVAARVREMPPQPLLRVPLLIERRDTVARELQRRRIKIYFVYDPPLDEYSGPEFTDPSCAPEAAGWWSRHVLPIDPRDAERVVNLVRTKEISLTPASQPMGG
jgi:hypothetical protein